jgi:formylglycine-generating enzyme required for sulfatase activity
VGSVYTLSNTGTNAEGIASNYNASGNAHIFEQLGGPIRVGIFAGHPSNTGRPSSGAGYYGVMELSGNLWERSVTVGRLQGRLFTGQHGDGTLATNGNADTPSWPGISAVGSNYRNGSWLNAISLLQVSNRSNGAFSLSVRNNDLGFRGCRSAPNLQIGN